MSQQQATGDCDYIFKVIVIGDSGSGKSSLTVRLSEDVFFSDYASTIAIDFRMHFMVYNGQKIRIQIWDTAGQERFLAVSTAFYRGANGVLLCYDITNRQSFEHLGAWLDRVKMQALPGIPVVLVGCKADEGTRNRAVSVEEAAAWATSHGMTYLETSAKTKDNVTEAFQKITQKMLEDLKQRGKNATGDNNNAGNNNTNGGMRIGGTQTVGLAPAPGRPGGPGFQRKDANESGCPC
jgi:small GTP-binding protein